MKKKEEKKGFLKNELKGYESETPMTTKERRAVREWVRSGKSVHENGSCASDACGHPLDYLDAYRNDMEENERMDAMSVEGRKEYLYERYGIGREMVPASLYEGQKGQMRLLYRKCLLYLEFLASNGLREEAEEYAQERMDDDLLPLDAL